MRTAIEAGMKKIFEGHTTIDDSFKAAEDAQSNTTIVNACKGSLRIHLESLRFTLELKGIDVAAALKKDPSQHESRVKDMQKAIIEKAEHIIQMALSSATSTQQVFPFLPLFRILFQVSEIQHYRDTLENIKQALSETSLANQIEILKTVITADPHIHSSAGRGHIYRCPQGHMYIIGECGRANQSGRCPDCGSVIGGGGHVLEAHNQLIRAEDAQRFGL